MKTTPELRNELVAAEEQRVAAKKAWLATRQSGQLIFDNEEYKVFCNIERAVKDIEKQIKVAERFEVQVGDGVTYRLYSDSKACTVISRTAKTITIQEDKTTLDPNFKPEWVAGGFAGHCTNQNEQTYTYETNPNGAIYKCHWSEKYGMFMDGGKDGCKVFNGRHEFYDYNF